MQSPYAQVITNTDDIPTDFPFDELKGKNDVAPLVECYHFNREDSSPDVQGYYYIFKKKNQNLKGRYNFSGPDELGVVVYHAPDGTIQNIATDGLFSQYLVCFNNKLYANKEYFLFDDLGRVFISVLNTMSGTPEILMYDPLSGRKTRFVPNPRFRIILDFDISEDGEWLFINGRTSENKGAPNIVYVMKTSNSKYSILLQSKFSWSEIPMICYFPKTKSLYFTDLSSTGISGDRNLFDYGLYVCRKNDDGSYSPAGVRRYSMASTSFAGTYFDYYIMDIIHSNNNHDENIKYEDFNKYICSFGDWNSNAVFCVTKKNGAVVTGADAFKYLRATKKLDSFINDYRGGNWLNLEHWLFRSDGHGNVSTESAYTQNGSSKFKDSYPYATTTAFFYPYGDKLYAAVNKFERIAENNYDSDWMDFVSEIYEVIDNGDSDFYFFQPEALKDINPTSYHNEMPLRNPMQRTPLFETTSAGLLINDSDGKRVHIYKDGKTSVYNNRTEFELSLLNTSRRAENKAEAASVAEIGTGSQKEVTEKEVIQKEAVVIVSTDSGAEKNKVAEKKNDTAQNATEATAVVEVTEDAEVLEDAVVVEDAAVPEIIETTEESIADNTTEIVIMQKRIIIILLFIIVAGLITSAIFIIKRMKEKRDFIRNQKIQKYNIQEEERAKISRDIHDSVVQDIRTIRLEIELLKVIPESEFQLKKVIDLATNCILKLRNICYNLTPAELVTHQEGDSAEIELISMIKNIVVQFTERTHIPCSLNIEENFLYPVFEKNVNVQLFRVMQEALNNIEKHSYATSTRIFIKNEIKKGGSSQKNGNVQNQRLMIIYINDDGIGCDVDKMLSKSKKMHFGVASMQERMNMIGGTIEFFSRTGDGMEIKLSVPVDKVVEPVQNVKEESEDEK